MAANALSRWLGDPADHAGYPISDEARRSIRQARTRDASFEMARVLRSGGYSAGEIDAIIAVLRPYLEQGEKPSASDVRRGLVEHGFPDDQAQIVAQAFPPR